MSDELQGLVFKSTCFSTFAFIKSNTKEASFSPNFCFIISLACNGKLAIV
jgi:hypothetical protein